MEPSNQREFTRVPIQVRVEVKGGGLCIRSSATQNLSQKGLLVTCSEKLPVDTECEVVLLLGEGEGEVRVEAEGKVIRCYPEGIALQFTRILGLESFDHLRKLLLYNAPDPDQVEQEFNTAVGIHRNL